MCSNEFFSKDAMWKILEAGVCCSRRDVLRWKHENLCLLAYKVRVFCTHWHSQDLEILVVGFLKCELS